MTITLEQMYEMQKELDARIIAEKGLEGVDLLPNTVLALQVEIAELANEWRGFKHWSGDREPRIIDDSTFCSLCDGSGTFDVDWDAITDCVLCEGTGFKNPLLEEYVDCLHFFLSIAVKKGWKDDLYIWDGALEERREKGLDGGIGGALIETIYWVSKMHMEKENKHIQHALDSLGVTHPQFCFRMAWFVFVAIGLIGFGFTWDQIATAYVEKNRVNHERQGNGY